MNVDIWHTLASLYDLASGIVLSGMQCIYTILLVLMYRYHHVCII